MVGEEEEHKYSYRRKGGVKDGWREGMKDGGREEGKGVAVFTCSSWVK